MADVNFPGVLSHLHTKLKANQNPSATWGSPAIADNQDSTESICLAILCLRNESSNERDRALEALQALQNADGSWPTFSGDERDGCWVTALVTMTLMAVAPEAIGLLWSIQWLLGTKGREANWFWRWKFRAVDKSVSFNPAKYGWSWVPGTTSWVIPTAFSLITLQQVRNRGIARAAAIDERIDMGVAMLLDRMCPGGGWNAGNGLAFGVAYTPYIDATAIALLALANYEKQRGVQASLDWLWSRLPGCPSPYSVAWGILALAAYRNLDSKFDQMSRRAAKELIALLEKSGNINDLCTIAISVLALEAVERDNVFEVRS